MRATRIVILVIVSSLLAFLTTTEAEQVLDYSTRLPIRWKDGCYLSAVVRPGAVHYIGKTEGSPYLVLKTEPWGKPSRPITLSSGAYTNDFILTRNPYYVWFKDTVISWSVLPISNRIDDSGRFGESVFWFVQEGSSGLYKMNYKDRETTLEVGIDVSNRAKADTYYLGLIEPYESNIAKYSSMRHVYFRFHKA